MSILSSLGEVDPQQSYPYPGSVHGVGVDRCVHPGTGVALAFDAERTGIAKGRGRADTAVRPYAC